MAEFKEIQSVQKIVPPKPVQHRQVKKEQQDKEKKHKGKEEKKGTDDDHQVDEFI